MKKEKIINFKKYEDFKKDVEAGELLDTSIVFVDDNKKIYTHGTEFDGNIPNWEAKDNEPGFIQNKPFEVTLGDLLYSRENVEFNGGENGDYYLSTSDGIVSCPLEEGKTYRLILDDDQYDFVCQRGGLNNAYLYLTDGITYNGWEFYVPNGGLVFFRCDAGTGQNCVVAKADYDQPAPVAKVEVYSLNIKTIDPSLLPITQETGEDKNLIMSQRATCIELDRIESKIPKVWFGTQDEYMKVLVKDPETLYFIKED